MQAAERRLQMGTSVTLKGEQDEDELQSGCGPEGSTRRRRSGEGRSFKMIDNLGILAEPKRKRRRRRMLIVLAILLINNADCFLRVASEQEEVSGGGRAAAEEATVAPSSMDDLHTKDSSKQQVGKNPTVIRSNESLAAAEVARRLNESAHSPPSRAASTDSLPGAGSVTAARQSDSTSTTEASASSSTASGLAADEDWPLGSPSGPRRASTEVPNGEEEQPTTVGLQLVAPADEADYTFSAALPASTTMSSLLAPLEPAETTLDAGHTVSPEAAGWPSSESASLADRQDETERRATETQTTETRTTETRTTEAPRSGEKRPSQTIIRSRKSPTNTTGEAPLAKELAQSAVNGSSALEGWSVQAASSSPAPDYDGFDLDYQLKVTPDEQPPRRPLDSSSAEGAQTSAGWLGLALEQPSHLFGGGSGQSDQNGTTSAPLSAGSSATVKELPARATNESRPAVQTRDERQLRPSQAMGAPLIPSLLTLASEQLSSQEMARLKPHFLLSYDSDSSADGASDFDAAAAELLAQGDLLATATGAATSLHSEGVQPAHKEPPVIANQTLGVQQLGAQINSSNATSGSLGTAGGQSIVGLLNGSPLRQSQAEGASLGGGQSSASRRPALNWATQPGRQSNNGNSPELTTIVVDGLQSSSTESPADALSSPAPATPPASQTRPSGARVEPHSHSEPVAVSPRPPHTVASAQQQQQQQSQQANSSHAHQWFNYPHPNLHHNPLLLHHILNKPASFYGASGGPSAGASPSSESARGSESADSASTSQAPPAATKTPSQPESGQAGALPAFVSAALGQARGQQSAAAAADIVERPTLAAAEPTRQQQVNATLLQMQLDQLSAITAAAQRAKQRHRQSQSLATEPAQQQPRPPKGQQVITSTFAPATRAAVHAAQPFGGAHGAPKHAADAAQLPTASRQPVRFASQMIAAPSYLQEVYTQRPAAAQLGHWAHARPEQRPAAVSLESLVSLLSGGANTTAHRQASASHQQHATDQHQQQNQQQSQQQLSDEDMSTYVALLASLSPPASATSAAPAGPEGSAQNSNGSAGEQVSEQLGALVQLFSKSAGQQAAQQASSRAPPRLQPASFRELDLAALGRLFPGKSPQTVSGQNALETDNQQQQSKAPEQSRELPPDEKAHRQSEGAAFWLNLLRDAKLIGLSDEVQAQIYREHLAPLHQAHSSGRPTSRLPASSQSPAGGQSAASSASGRESQLGRLAQASVQQARLEQQQLGQLAFVEALRASLARLQQGGQSGSAQSAGAPSGGAQNETGPSGSAWNGPEFDEWAHELAQQNLSSNNSGLGSSQAGPHGSQTAEKQLIQDSIIHESVRMMPHWPGNRAPLLALGQSPFGQQQQQQQQLRLLGRLVGPVGAPMARPPVGRLRPVYPLGGHRPSGWPAGAPPSLLGFAGPQPASSGSAPSAVNIAAPPPSLMLHQAGQAQRPPPSPTRIMLDRFPMNSAPAYILKLPTHGGGTITTAANLQPPLPPGARLAAALRGIPLSQQQRPAAFVSGGPVGALRFLNAIAPPRLRTSGQPASYQHPGGLVATGLRPAPSTLHVHHQQAPLSLRPPFASVGGLLQSQRPHATSFMDQPAATPLLHPAGRLYPQQYGGYASSFQGASAGAETQQVAAAQSGGASGQSGESWRHEAADELASGPQPSSADHPHSADHQQQSSATPTNSAELAGGQSVQVGSVGPVGQLQQVFPVHQQPQFVVQPARPFFQPAHQTDFLMTSPQHQLVSSVAAVGQPVEQSGPGAALARLQQATASLVELTSLASLVEEMVKDNEIDSSPALALANAINTITGSQSAALRQNLQSSSQTRGAAEQQVANNNNNNINNSDNLSNNNNNNSRFNNNNGQQPFSWKSLLSWRNGANNSPVQQAKSALSPANKLRELSALLASLGGLQASTTLGAQNQAGSSGNLQTGGPQAELQPNTRLRVKYIRVPVAVYETNGAQTPLAFMNGAQRELVSKAQLAELNAAANGQQTSGQKASSGQEAADQAGQSAPGRGGKQASLLAEPNSLASVSSGAETRPMQGELGAGGSQSEAQAEALVFDEMSAESGPQHQFVAGPAGLSASQWAGRAGASSSAANIHAGTTYPNARPLGIEGGAATGGGLLTLAGQLGGSKQPAGWRESSRGKSKRKGRKRGGFPSFRSKKKAESQADEETEEEERDPDEQDDLASSDLPILESILSVLVHGATAAAASPVGPLRLNAGAHPASLLLGGGKLVGPQPLVPWRPRVGLRGALLPAASEPLVAYTAPLVAPAGLPFHQQASLWPPRGPLPLGGAAVGGPPAPPLRHQLSLGEVVGGALGARSLLSGLLAHHQSRQQSKHSTLVGLGSNKRAATPSDQLASSTSAPPLLLKGSLSAAAGAMATSVRDRLARVSHGGRQSADARRHLKVTRPEPIHFPSIAAYDASSRPSRRPGPRGATHTDKQLAARIKTRTISNATSSSSISTSSSSVLGPVISGLKKTPSSDALETVAKNNRTVLAPPGALDEGHHSTARPALAAVEKSKGGSRVNARGPILEEAAGKSAELPVGPKDAPKPPSWLRVEQRASTHMPLYHIVADHYHKQNAGHVAKNDHQQTNQATKTLTQSSLGNTSNTSNTVNNSGPSEAQVVRNNHYRKQPPETKASGGEKTPEQSANSTPKSSTIHVPTGAA